MLTRVRPIQKRDIEPIYIIEQFSHRAPWSREILSDCLLVGYDCRLAEVGFPDRQIVGYIICRHTANICHILNLCVDLKRQRQGYGELLLRSVLASLAGTAVDTMILEVRPSNLAALSLYEKLGFIMDTVKEKYYEDGDEREDAIVLKKILVKK